MKKNHSYKTQLGALLSGEIAFAKRQVHSFEGRVEKQNALLAKGVKALEKAMRKNPLKAPQLLVAGLKQTRPSQAAGREFFFSFQKIPPFGKEYWFLSFASQADGRQIIFTFGRATKELSVNRKRQKTSDPKDCVAVCWGFSGGKKFVLHTGQCPVRASVGKKGVPSFVGAKGEGFFVSLEGEEEFDFSCSKNGKQVFKAKLFPPKKAETKIESDEFAAGAFGYRLLNMYFDFQGTLHGKPITGKAYLQKVLIVSPFVPWKWARCVLENGGVVELFEITAPSPDWEFAPKPLQLLSNYCIQMPGKKRVHKKCGVKIERIETKEGSRWVASSQDGKVFVEAKDYAAHNFEFKGTAGKFVYEEHFANASDLFAMLGKNKMRASKATCLFEDAKGFLI